MMSNKRNGLNDFDNIFVTIALWISMAALFATSLTLPMLPSEVTIFYKPTDFNISYYSKYNNLLNTFFSVIPAAIIILAASLKKHYKITRNFTSIILFCIMFSACVGGVVIYGISKQFSANETLKSVDVNTLISLILSAFFSFCFAVIPLILHTPFQMVKKTKRSVNEACFLEELENHWNVGTYGYLVAGIMVSFIPGIFAYIPLTAFTVGLIVFFIVKTKIDLDRKTATEAE